MVQWPPTPCVEDEEVSLAKEHVLHGPRDTHKGEDHPGNSRGAVDQYPIILDNVNPSTNGEAKVPPKDKPCGLVPDSSSLDEPQEPLTPPAATNHERRFVFIPSPKPAPEPLRRPEPLHRSKSTTQLSQEDAYRGRPQVTRIRTDVGPGLEAMVTGQRRAPSPYAHTRTSSALDEAFVPTSRPKESLLSPMSAQQPRRPVSVRPGPRFTGHDSSDSDHKSKSRRHERSRSRAARFSFSQSDRSETEKPKRSKSSRRPSSPDSRSSRDPRRHRSRGPNEGGVGTYSYTTQDHITPPQTPKPAAEAKASTAIEQAPAPFPTGNRQQPRRGVSDSPYTSSAEDTHARRNGSGDETRAPRGDRSRRGSRSHSEREDELRSHRARSQRRDRDRDADRKERPTRTYHGTDERSRYEPLRSPLSSHKTPRDPKAMEDYFEKAFEANQKKPAKQAPDESQHPSPMTSPPRSRPHTPRGEKPVRDYFEPVPQTFKMARQRSRPPSMDEGHLKDLKPFTTLLGAATLGASLAAKAIPSLSRSNTTQSGDTPSSGSQSRPSSGQRSRKPSPVLSDGTTPSTQPVPMPASRTNSLATRDDLPATRTTTYTVHDGNVLTKTVPHAPLAHVEIPRTASRASSYSYSPEQSRPAVLNRASSSTIGIPTQQAPQFPAQPVSGPSSISPQVGTPVGPLPSRGGTLPACPRTKPIAGCHDWYTIRDFPNVYFCPTCMKHIGNSPFRDYFILNFSNDPHQPISCSMSNPWFRFGWTQTMRQENPNLSLLWTISIDPPPETKKCSGAQNDLRKWYHLTDPRTKKPVENFDVCSACVRTVDLIFPSLRSYLFDRPSDKLAQEKICNMNAGSRHLPTILIELQRLADWKESEQLRQRDIYNFVDLIRRIARYRECARDTMLATQLWHYIPELPQFTVCEACFDEVVWPQKDRPIARDVSKSVRQVPVLLRTQMLPGISCQLYSERMRRLFNEACYKNDFESLKNAARYRYEMEHRLQHNHKVYEHELKMGIDKRAEIENNITFWKSIE